MKLYHVTIDVFFMEDVWVYAKTKKEAIEKARNAVEHGMGEEKTVHAIEEDEEL